MRARAHLEQPRPTLKRRRMSVVAIVTSASVLMLGTALPASGRPSVTDSPHPGPSAAQSTAQQTADEAPSPAQTSALDEIPEPSESAEGTPDASTPSSEAPATSADAGEDLGATPDAPALEQTPSPEFRSWWAFGRV